MQTFQDLILTLQDFWSSKGCLIWQPYNQVVGAGTMNPATFLRVLGPEPWNVAYVEPSARADDGRFGENPNRLYTHTQFQVILKPSPERSQDVYLESLDAIGIDRRKHDIRFVEDNWAQPAIGAWGLGWEVWIDGLEITQYTYFQQVGGVTLDPVPLELTYGLERIAMFLQGARTVFDLKWDDVRTYGDVKLQDEIERSQYAFNYADVEELHQLFEIYERESKRALEYGLVLPAHDYVLQCSNVFNLLDTRGAIGVTERQSFLGRMRDLAREVAAKYVAQREAMGFPWLKPKIENAELRIEKSERGNISQFSILNSQFNNTLLVELGTEELPADDVTTAQEQLGRLLIAALDDARLDHEDIRLYATPRRVAAVVNNVAPQQRALDEWMKGPAAKAAFDKDGKPTLAAIGFAKRFNLAPEDLIVREEDSGSYVYARKREEGKPAVDVLAQALPAVLGKIAFEKTMRWNASNVAFARPIDWIVAMLGNQVIPFEFAGVRSGNASEGPRGEGSKPFTVVHADNYQLQITNHHIIGDMHARRDEIRKQIDAIAANVGGRVVADVGLLDEVTNLVEQPTALLGSFDPDFLHIPAPVLTTVMRKHQRYFSIVDADGQLLPHFIAVRNGNAEHLDEVREGNEAVLRARFADAAYFFKHDTSRPLEAYLPRLDTITFQSKLGSMLDKTKRIESLVEPIAAWLDDGRQTTDDSNESIVNRQSSIVIAKQAAHLCKADLATSMVIDFTSLQGVMGREYYLIEGGDSLVAEAIYEHYLPRYAGDATPKTETGFVVALADKLDSIAGLFAVGLAPKGSADPFALRRAAIGVVQNLIAHGRSFSVRKGLTSAAARLPVKMSEDALDAAHKFIVERARAMFVEEGYRYDVVDAVLAELGDNPSRAKLNIEQLNKAVECADWPTTLAAYARCARIVRTQNQESRTEIHDPEPAAQELANAVDGMKKPADVQSLISNLQSLTAPITTFFDKVLVMTDDAGLRQSRLALLQRIVAQATGIADLSKLEGF
jgi:glycyl-tRNA synthetase